MAVISDIEIANHAQAGGFRHSRSSRPANQAPDRALRELEAAVAIALAESGGETTANGDGGNSYGLMQIFMPGDLGAARREAYGLASNDELYDPATNMRVAYAIYENSKGIERDRKFDHWSVYRRPYRYQMFADRARDAVEGSENDDNFPDLPGEDQLRGIAEFFKFLSDTKNWIRVAYFIGGGVALMVGLGLLFWNEANPVKIAAKVVRRR